MFTVLGMFRRGGVGSRDVLVRWGWRVWGFALFINEIYAW